MDSQLKNPPVNHHLLSCNSYPSRKRANPIEKTLLVKRLSKISNGAQSNRLIFLHPVAVMACDENGLDLPEKSVSLKLPLPVRRLGHWSPQEAINKDGFLIGPSYKLL